MGLPARVHSQATHQAGEQAESTAALQVPLAALAACLLADWPACDMFGLLACWLVLSAQAPTGLLWR
jgi:hypothetical protein